MEATLQEFKLLLYIMEESPWAYNHKSPLKE